MIATSFSKPWSPVSVALNSSAMPPTASRSRIVYLPIVLGMDTSQRAHHTQLRPTSRPGDKQLASLAALAPDPQSAWRGGGPQAPSVAGATRSYPAITRVARHVDLLRSRGRRCPNSPTAAHHRRPLLLPHPGLGFDLCHGDDLRRLRSQDGLVPDRGRRAPAVSPRGDDGARARKRPVAPTAKLDGAVLTERNIFCSECVPEKPSSNNGVYRGEPIMLIATTIADAGPRATLRVLSTEVQGSWGLDDKVPGVGKITRVGGISIDVMDESGNTKTVSLLDAQAAVTGGTAMPPDGHAPRKAENPFEGRIKKLTDGSYEVDRGVVRELVAGGGANAGATASPIVEKNEVKGLRMRGVRPNSAAGQIGLRSGDTIAAIDGEQIKTMEQMLDLYGKLDKMNGIELQGTRAGKPLSIQLRFK